MKMEFLFAGLNPNIIIQKKAPEKCTVFVWCIKNNGCWDFVAVCPSPLSKFLATRLSWLLSFV